MSDESWPLPDDIECPECGEDEQLMGHVVEEDPDGVVEADLVCGVGAVDGQLTGCGHQWTWTRGDDS